MTEMEKLVLLLNEARIPYETVKHVDNSLQICYPKGPAGSPDCVCDVVCFHGSYGGDEGLLEILGLVNKEAVGDDIEGWLTADIVFGRIWKHYINNIRFKDTYFYIRRNNGLSEECNDIMEYILQTSPEIKFLKEDGDYALIKTTKMGTKIINFLKKNYMLSIYFKNK